MITQTNHCIKFHERNSEILEKFIEFKTMVEVQIGYKLKILKTNNRGEFISRKFDHFCIKNDILQHLILLYSPQQNRVVVRKNCTLVESAKSMIYDIGLSTIFWAKVIATITYIQNRVSNCNQRHNSKRSVSWSKAYYFSSLNF